MQLTHVNENGSEPQRLAALAVRYGRRGLPFQNTGRDGTPSSAVVKSGLRECASYNPRMSGTCRGRVNSGGQFWNGAVMPLAFRQPHAIFGEPAIFVPVRHDAPQYF
jgi:hypothetical protein